MEAVELFNQGGKDGVPAGGGVELGQGRVTTENPCQGVLDGADGLLREFASVNGYFEARLFYLAYRADLRQEELAFDV